MLNNRCFIRTGFTVKSAAVMILLLAVLAPLSYAGESEDLIAAARKEGKVMYYSAMSLPDSTLMAREFEKKYPFMKVEIMRMPGEKLVVRAIMEARAKSNKADVFQTSVIQVNQMKENKFLAPYASPSTQELPPKFRDAEGYWSATYILPYVMMYNTKQIPPKEAPKSYEDLLSPKWKGKIGLEAEDQQWFFHLVKLMGREKGMDFMKKLARQDLLIRKGHTLLTTLCAAGEIPIVVVAYLNAVQQAQEKGASVDWVRFKSSPIITAINAIGVVADAPHPNAARLFYNFVISKDGARVFNSVDRIPANPEEQPPEVKNLNLYMALPQEFMANYKQIQKEWDEIFHTR